MRKLYKDLKIGQEVKVQKFYGRLTENYFTGKITNMDGQNIVIEVKDKEINEPVVDGDILKFREFEACNPEYAVVS